jgi:hypothetical protein
MRYTRRIGRSAASLFRSPENSDLAVLAIVAIQSLQFESGLL